MDIATTTATQPIDQMIERFARSFSIAHESLIEAARIYGDAIAAHGNEARRRFAEMVPRVTPGTWRRLEALSAGRMDARLISASSCGAEALRKMPVAVQREALDHGIPVLSNDGSELLMQAENLTPTLVRQVFARDRIRTTAEQRAWKESEGISTESAPVAVRMPWRVRPGGKVQISKPCELTRVQLMNILAEMG